MPSNQTLRPYDGVLLLSFGGPEHPEQVMPFLRSVTAGKGVPDERLADVAEHYHHFGGRSPIGQETRALLAELQAQIDARGLEVPVLLANRHLRPSVLDALREASARGLRRLVCVLTSAYPCYSSCRQYREDLAAGVAAAHDAGIDVAIDKVGQYAGTPAFREPQRAALVEAVSGLSLPDERLTVLFVTHSVPVAMQEHAGPGGRRYTAEHQAVAADAMAAVRQHLGRSPASELVYCSRSGPPSQPWLEPDVNDRIRALAAAGVHGVVVAPIGFVSDHMEVVYDLDIEAAKTAAEEGLRFVRVPTVGRDPQFAAGLVDLLLERAALARGETVGPAGSLPAVCVGGCCPNPRGHKPALCGQD